VKHTPTNVFLGLPFTQMARDQIGNPLTINTLVMGAVSHLLDFADVKLMRKGLEANMPAKIVDVNVKAFTLGLKQAKKHFGDAHGLWAAAEVNGSAEVETDHE